MDVWIQAVGFLKRYTSRSMQAVQVAVAPGTTAHDLLNQLDIPIGEVMRVAVNGQIVPFDYVLAPGDTVRVIPPIGGG